MRMTASILALALTIVTTPALARPLHFHSFAQGLGYGLMHVMQSGNQPATWFDVAAQPAYPVAAYDRRGAVVPLARVNAPRGRSSGLTSVKIASGQVITVATAYADRFVGFLNALYRREGSLPDVGCYSPTGHMRGSLHHWGGACDVGQSRRNVAWKPMYHVTELAHEFGLTDGCEWRDQDCGHVDVSGIGGSRQVATHRRRYASK